MGNRKSTVVAGMLALALLVVPGCIGKTAFRQSVEDTDGRITAVESAIEDNGRKISDLRTATDKKLGEVGGQASQALQTGQQAMTKAEAAELSARGKLLWTVMITDDQVKFDFGKAGLRSDAISVLDRTLDKVKAYGKALYFEIEGHTDNAGTDARNHELGMERARAVRDYLHKSGVPLHAMSMISFGEARPIADNSSKAGRAQNRRVVIRVLE